MLVGKPLHSDEQPGGRRIVLPSRHFPTVDDVIYTTPPAEIEIADAEITPFREFEGVFQPVPILAIKEGSLDIVKYGGHLD